MAHPTLRQITDAFRFCPTRYQAAERLGVTQSTIFRYARENPRAVRSAGVYLDGRIRKVWLKLKRDYRTNDAVKDRALISKMEDIRAYFIWEKHDRQRECRL